MSECNDRQLGGIFVDGYTGLEELKAAGWLIIPSSGDCWWFERYEEVEGKLRRTGRQSPPVWVYQMVRQAYERGRSDAQSQMRRALGLTSSAAPVSTSNE